MLSCVSHGRMVCRRCWTDAELRQGVKLVTYPISRRWKAPVVGDFKLVHDPGHWGATDPRTLVLGISKGNTQSNAYQNEPFDAVAFKGFRDRLLDVLQSVGLLTDETDTQFESRFTATEREFAFASVVRCSLTVKKKGFYTASSRSLLPAFRPQSGRQRQDDFVSNCVEQHLNLANLPPRTNLVLLLSNQKGYIDALKNVVATKRGPVTDINKVAYWSVGVKFVHLIHPSPVNRNHFDDFIRGEETQQGAKRDLAKAALAVSA